jgi:Biotin/lipoate A/B protein ligase family
MSPESIGTRTSRTPELDLPPVFRLVTLREVGNAVAYARMHAAELGAGTLVSVGRFDVAEFAVVLEPDEPLALSWRALYAGMVALAKAVAAIAPPANSVAIEWPDAVRVDGIFIGGGRLAWPDGADAALPPPWLIFGAITRLGLIPREGSEVHPLAEANIFDNAGPSQLAERFARHLMRITDRWSDAGFSPVVDEYLSHLRRTDGVHHTICDDGDLLVRRDGASSERHRLEPKLVVPSWLHLEDAC